MLFKIIIAIIAYFIIGGMVETFCEIWQRDHDFLWENTIILNEDSTGERVSVIIGWPVITVVFLCLYIPLAFGKIGYNHNMNFRCIYYINM